VAKQFIRCSQCGRAFVPASPEQTLCSSCNAKAVGQLTEEELLVTCRNYLREADDAGRLVTVDEVAEATGIPEEKVWEFIKGGLVSTLSFNDPKVRAYLLKKEQEQLRELMRETRQERDTAGEKPRGGYHSFEEER